MPQLNKMKKVREYLYEIFREEGDPIKDMGIGWTMDQIVKAIYKEDSKHNLSALYLGKKAKTMNIHEIVVTGAVGRGKQMNVGTYFKIIFWRERMVHPTKKLADGRPKTMTGKDKMDYAMQLVQSIGIGDYFTNVSVEYHTNWVVDFKINPDFKYAFKPGNYPSNY